MGPGEVVYLGDRRAAPSAKEYAILLRLLGEDVQFKVFGELLLPQEKAELANALDRAAQSLRQQP